MLKLKKNKLSMSYPRILLDLGLRRVARLADDLLRRNLHSLASGWSIHIRCSISLKRNKISNSDLQIRVHKGFFFN